jgi:hypothetical protein
MVARLSRETEIYKTFVSQLETLTNEVVVDLYKVPVWESLVEQEVRQSEQFLQLVRLQDKIITTLLSGRLADSPEITLVLAEVAQAQESLIVANLQSGKIREELIPL